MVPIALEFAECAELIVVISDAAEFTELAKAESAENVSFNFITIR